MTSDLNPEDVVVRVATPQIIIGSEAGPGGSRAGGGAGELGRRLLVAARAGDTSLVLDLMAKGAPFTTDWLGTSPLHLAASNGHVETCGVLLRAGVSRDSRTKVDRTPLHLAAYAGHADVTELLLDHGAMVDCRDMLRMTPLHWAAQRGHATVCSVLVKAGADPRVTSKFDKTPRSLARGDAAVALDAALRAREAAASVRAIAPEQQMDEPMEMQPQPIPTVQRIPEIKIKPKPMPEKMPEKPTKPEIKTEVGAGGGCGAESAGARLLRRHGITLLPPDPGGTVLSALQGGRTVVLSDAGKLMLKESGAGRGVVVRATPVRTAAAKGKVFTLRGAHSTRELHQVKVVQMSGGVGRRPPVKIIMNKANLGNLVSHTATVPTPAQPESVFTTIAALYTRYLDSSNMDRHIDSLV